MKKFISYTDDELVALLHQNEYVAFKEIYKRYWYKLYLAAYKRLRDKGASEEIVQNLFTKLWCKRHQTRIQASLAAYLFTAVRYSVIDYMAKEATKKKYLEMSYHNETEAEDNYIENKIYVSEIELYMDRLLEKMPYKCRSVFMMSRKEYKSNREIALLLNISEKTVENHLTNALKVLRLSFKKILVVIVISLLGSGL